MKRNVWFLIVAAMMTLGNSRAPAQADGTAAAIAAREDAEERYRRLNSACEELQAKQTALDKSIAGLKEQLGKLQEENAKATAGKASQDDFKRLADRIDDLDQKREADKKLILEKLKELAVTLKTPAPIVTPSVTPVPRGSTTNRSDQESGFYYTVQSRDTFPKIAKMYQDNGIKVTWQQIKEANPLVDPAKLLIGQKIFIPQPKP